MCPVMNAVEDTAPPVVVLQVVKKSAGRSWNLATYQNVRTLKGENSRKITPVLHLVDDCPDDNGVVT
jgi:hypothetical protein